MKYWNFGNTTVRNPERIFNGFLLFREHFEGKPWKNEDHKRFYELLVKAGIITASPKRASDTSKEITGRKWVSIFHKFGLKRWHPTSPAIITKLGNLYAEGKITDEELFLRQLIKFRFPSPYDKKKDYLGFDVHPFYVVLEAAFNLNSKGLVGLSKQELALYIVTCLRDSDIEENIERIVKFRKEFEITKGIVARRELFHKKKIELLSELHKSQLAERRSLLTKFKKGIEKNREFAESSVGNELLKKICTGGKGSNTKASKAVQRQVISLLLQDAGLENAFAPIKEFLLKQRATTLNDYADTAVRYSMKTGLFSIQKNKLAIKKSRLLFVSSIVKNFKGTTLKNFDEQFYDPKLPELPYESEDFLMRETSFLLEQYVELCKSLKIMPELPLQIPKEPQQMRAYRAKVEEKLREARQTDFSMKQNTPEEAADIEATWEDIKNEELMGGEAYMPAYFEWVIWRIFLAIDSLNNAISETRGFDIDEDIRPRSHALSGKPDMNFEYDDFILVTEATLATGSAQWSREYESVPRHVAKLMESSRKKVYGIFVSPSIDNNQANTLFKATWFIKDKEVVLNIIPLEMDLVVNMLKERVQGKFDVSKLKILLGQCIELKKDVRNGKEWYTRIRKKCEELLGSVPLRSEQLADI